MIRQFKLGVPPVDKEPDWITPGSSNNAQLSRNGVFICKSEKTKDILDVIFRFCSDAWHHVKTNQARYNYLETIAFLARAMKKY